MTVVCDYCGSEAELVGGDVIYPHRPDLAGKKIWRCSPCDAYVGTHQDSDAKPLGRLANRDLREAKIAAHAAFDPLWRAKVRRDGCSRSKARGKGYKWLAGQLGIEAKDCHIGMFDVETCRRVVAVVEGCGKAGHDHPHHPRRRSMMNKAEYVKGQRQTRPHTCHWPGCDKQVPPAMWGCKAHWFRLPLSLRHGIWATYEPGQEVDMTPSRGYLDAVKAVEKWIRENAQ